MNYYNEHDPKAAAWLRELIRAGEIPAGDVDERSIVDVQPADLARYTQCHFFAGIGGWSYALRLAGWPTDRPVWTGSCPCQPFSSAGKSGGGGDPRHLWPAWYRLIRECRPPVLFGEQVEAAVGHGWLDLVCDDLEREGYAVGAVGLPAASVGAPHIRQRLWFVADASTIRHDGVENIERGRESDQPTRNHDVWGESVGQGKTGELADAERRATERHRHDMGSQARGVEGPAQERQRLRDDIGDGESVERLADANDQPKQSRDAGRSREGVGTPRDGRDESRGSRVYGELGDPIGARSQGQPRHVGDGHEPRRVGAVTVRSAPATGEVEQLGDPDEAGRNRRGKPEPRGLESARGEQPDGSSAGRPAASPWSDLLWLPCRDGKARPIESGLQPLAHGVSARVGRLRGYGNAIVPQVAAEVIRAYLETI